MFECSSVKSLYLTHTPQWKTVFMDGKDEFENEECGFFRNESSAAFKNVVEDPSILVSILVPVKPKDCCMHCGRVPLDYEVKNVFDISVCTSCSRTELKFITKTKCLQDYLLTPDELKQFKYLTRPNPHKNTWNDMQLFIESQIQEFAVGKHGKLETIEKLKEDRKIKNKTRKLESVRRRVKDLKKRTFLTHYEEKHIHKFISKGNISICECGMSIEEEEL
ncbi:DNA repair protein [Vittaforma corneae ATCC 50505]|uniref:DNA repair protein n=1 Tax=Vittaforma corneae (strain ATCC 50505) TaxID=993615 RepID=L2GPG7_VITCO|nr:DNA repair protein [Vittaforma corneae ATCC 50505]ELA42783.1 DNA repair protein [Vittaforma corneae ATCC 50505]